MQCELDGAARALHHATARATPAQRGSVTLRHREGEAAVVGWAEAVEAARAAGTARAGAAEGGGGGGLGGGGGGLGGGGGGLEGGEAGLVGGGGGGEGGQQRQSEAVRKTTAGVAVTVAVAVAVTMAARVAVAAPKQGGAALGYSSCTRACSPG